MTYKIFTLPQFGFEIEVAVVPADDTSSFLKKIKIKSGKISKKEYEDNLIDALVKDPVVLQDFLHNLETSQDKTQVHYSVLAAIYDLNSRLRPQQVVIIEDKLMHQSDALRSGLLQKDKQNKSTPLSTNPAWVESAESVLNYKPIQKLVNDIWEGLKKKSPEKDYIKQNVALLNVEIPILDISSIKLSLEDVIEGYIEKRCEGDLVVAKSSPLLWKIHIITLAIPRVEEIADALYKGGFINYYTDTLVMTQLYLATVNVNPSLDWSTIDWRILDKDAEGDTPSSLPRPKVIKGRKIPNLRGVKTNPRRSSKAEAEAEQAKFTDISAQEILALGDKVKKRIIGQDEVVDALMKAIAVSRVGLRGDKKPIGSFLLAGTTGVGKTELAKVLADELTNGVLHRVDCQEYQERHEVSKIFGAPPGYAGFETGKPDDVPPVTLASKLKENPFGLVLFDEVERAHNSLHNVLLHIMDEGEITSGRGDTVKFNQAIICLTSNVGTKEAAFACEQSDTGFQSCEYIRDDSKLEKEIIDREVKKQFKPEFLNRLSGKMFFNKLTPELCLDIVDVLLNKTTKNLEKAQHLTMAWDKKVNKLIVDVGYSALFGGRELERAIQEHIELPLALHILERDFKFDSEKISLTVKGDKISFK